MHRASLESPSRSMQPRRAGTRSAARTPGAPGAPGPANGRAPGHSAPLRALAGAISWPCPCPMSDPRVHPGGGTPRRPRPRPAADVFRFLRVSVTLPAPPAHEVISPSSWARSLPGTLSSRPTPIRRPLPFPSPHPLRHILRLPCRFFFFSFPSRVSASSAAYVVLGPCSCPHCLLLTTAVNNSPRFRLRFKGPHPLTTRPHL